VSYFVLASVRGAPSRFIGSATLALWDAVASVARHRFGFLSAMLLW